jgi:hypothetical protein
MRPGDVTWTTNAATAAITTDPHSGVKMLYAQWPSAATAPALTVTALVSSRDRRVDLNGRGGPDLGFLMYPQAELGDQRKDSLSPAEFVYTIAAQER